MAFAVAATTLLALSSTGLAAPSPADPCAAIAGKTWAIPADVRACFNSFAFNTTIRNNLVDTVSKTLLQFHTSVTYSLREPYPYNEVDVDIKAELDRVRRTTYRNDFALHYDLQQAVRKLKDGHAGYTNYCYDSAFATYLPFPLAVIDGSIHITPESYDVIVGALGQDVVNQWQSDAKVQFQKYAGARVIAIDFKDPWRVVDENAAVVGGYETHTTRQNSFFSSYQAISADPGWAYRLGDFAIQALPLRDKVTLAVIRPGKFLPEIITVPTRARLNPSTLSFTDKASYWTNNCLAKSDTNGASIFDASSKKSVTRDRPAYEIRPGSEGSPIYSPAISAMVEDAIPPAPLPANLVPSLKRLDGSIGDLNFYMLPDGKTGILALGSFSYSYSGLYDSLPVGLQSLKDNGATRLIIDVTNNGGGYVCIAAWLNRLLAGAAIEPSPGLDTQMRGQPLPQQIVKIITSNSSIDPNQELLYNPRNWRPATLPLRYFNATEDYMTPGVSRVINGVKDHFSVRLGQDCFPFDSQPPSTEKAFPFENVIIVNNGRCASSCTLLSVPLAKKFGVRTAVVGGKPRTTQQYAGVIGGQSYSYAGIDSEVKSVGLKSSPLAPPDFILDAYQGFTFRLGFALQGNPDFPEEFTPHNANYNWQLTSKTVNNPAEIWKAIAAAEFKN